MGETLRLIKIPDRENQDQIRELIAMLYVPAPIIIIPDIIYVNGKIMPISKDICTEMEVESIAVYGHYSKIVLDIKIKEGDGRR